MTINWFTLTYAVYWGVVLYVTVQIIHQYTISSRASAWLFTIYVFPVVGVGLYFIFGVKRRKRKIYQQKLSSDQKSLEHYLSLFPDETKGGNMELPEALHPFSGLTEMIVRDGCSRLTAYNQVTLLENGEEKFPRLLKDIQAATQSIHLEYYIFRFDQVGNELLQALICKVKEGVTVRFIYDDYGSLGLNQSVLKRMRAHGIEAWPFSELSLFAFTDRLNYRNHRKIVVIDGQIAYIGGINVGNEYHNELTEGASDNQPFWRDSHLRIKGQAVAYLQSIFINDWNFCTSQQVAIDDTLGVDGQLPESGDQKLIQVLSSGPDSPQPTILFAMLQAIHAARDEILITTPYFLPNPAMTKALKIAVLSGVTVKVLVPHNSDNWVVNAAAQSYYYELLEVGVEFYKYTNGFIHAKTMVIDGYLSVMGTANFDERSFELNFEVNVMIYDHSFAEQLRDSFARDCTRAKQLNVNAWESRSAVKIFVEKLARLISPIL
ncbi:cardiolipin synthase [Marinicella sediminis]|uniref:Cardiolipin synthase n=1 Tax=Marinicella sediminis TaxID=1792834 RepID=A0ABV7J575_9GAMM|nr:cardiolipin synthase [Marinicella sediminis]